MRGCAQSPLRPVEDEYCRMLLLCTEYAICPLLQLHRYPSKGSPRPDHKYVHRERGIGETGVAENVERRCYAFGCL
eukprot:1184257-Prorocentrum_minimum.AAC.5